MAPRLPVYLDYHATTPVDPRVLARMQPYFCEVFGNAASQSHAFGRAAAAGVELARRQVATLIGASPAEIVFTSGATESNNLALKGVARPRLAAGVRPHIVITAIEHNAVLDPCRRLEAEGAEVTRLAVDRDGRLDLAALAAALRPDTVLVSVIAANNEIGVTQEIAAIGALTRPRGILLHSDATQAAGKIPLDVGQWQVDLLSISAHKMYGPKGVGALYVRRGLELDCQLDGGGHEDRRRSGTLNVAGIVGLGAAAELAAAELTAEAERLAALRDRLQQRILALVPTARLNGSRRHRLPNNLHLTFPGLEGEALMLSMGDLAVSSGSACSSGRTAASHVLRAIGLSDDEAHSSLRFGLGRFSTEEEIDFAAATVGEAVQALQALAGTAGTT